MTQVQPELMQKRVAIELLNRCADWLQIPKTFVIQTIFYFQKFYVKMNYIHFVHFTMSE